MVSVGERRGGEMCIFLPFMRNKDGNFFNNLHVFWNKIQSRQ